MVAVPESSVFVLSPDQIQKFEPLIGKNIVVVIPAYNEARFIGSVILSLEKYVSTVIVVDDGSTDNTAEIARAAGAYVVRLPENQGKGMALNRGFEEARNFSPDVVVMIDGDGQKIIFNEPIQLWNWSMEEHSRFTKTEFEDSVSIIIPAYNEELGLPFVLQSLEDEGLFAPGYEVIVIDDGSTDNTAGVVKPFPCKFIQHAENRGKGAAMRTGFFSSRGKKVIFMDADNTYPTSEIKKICNLLDENEFVRCSRDLGRENIPLINRIGNSFFDFLAKAIHSIDTGDVLTGLYGLQRDSLILLNLESNGFDIETEIVSKAKAFGLVSYVFKVSYQQRQGEKKLNVWKDGLLILRKSVKLAFSYNPMLFFMLPGFGLFTIGVMGIFLFRIGIPQFKDLPIAMHSIFLLGIISIVGLQLMTFSVAIFEAGNARGIKAKKSKLFNLFRTLISNRYSRFLSLSLFLWGVFVIGDLVFDWISSGFGPFTRTGLLVAASLSVITGIQFVTSTIFLSAVSRLYKNNDENFKTRPFSFD